MKKGKRTHILLISINTLRREIDNLNYKISDINRMIAKFSDREEKYENNVIRLNNMLLEAKGLISIVRSNIRATK